MTETTMFDGSTPAPESESKAKPKKRRRRSSKAKPANLFDLSDPSLGLRIDLLNDKRPYRPRLVIYDKETSEDKVMVDLTNFTDLAIVLHDAHVLGNESIDTSAWLSRTKQLRKNMGIPNHMDGIVPPDCVNEMMNVPLKGFTSADEWLARFDKAAKDLPASDVADIAYKEMPGVATSNEADRRSYLEQKDLKDLASMVRQMETLVRIGREWQERDKGMSANG